MLIDTLVNLMRCILNNAEWKELREHAERMAMLESTHGSFLSLGSETDPFEDERTRHERQVIVTDIIHGHIHGQHGVSPHPPTQLESQRELHSQLMNQKGHSLIDN